jgi:hypothetical protein
MAQNPFDIIRSQETPTSSFRWYQEMIRKVGLGSVQPQRVMRSNVGEFVTSVLPGQMYMFLYNPKTAEKLPYYDTVPVVLPFRKVADGFYGLNFHYLPPMLRMRLLERLMTLVNNEKMTETTRVNLSWKLLNNAAKFPGVHACVKRYLYKQMQSRIMRIYPQDWKKTIMLPIDNFEKEPINVVFNDSWSKM